MRGMFHEAYSAIEENSSTDGWHFEVDMTLGGNALATPYISSLGAYVTNDNILKLFIELFGKINKFLLSVFSNIIFFILIFDLI